MEFACQLINQMILFCKTVDQMFTSKYGDVISTFNTVRCRYEIRNVN